jgi:hypothetical protein
MQPDFTGLGPCRTSNIFGAKSSGCGHRSTGSAARSSNCNGREYPRRQRTPSLIECWLRSALFAPSATGSRKSSPWLPQAKPSVVGACDARALKWYDRDADNPPWIKALADVRHLAVVMRAEALSRQGRPRRRGRIEPHGDPATGDFSDAKVIRNRRCAGRFECVVKIDVAMMAGMSEISRHYSREPTR